MLAEGLPRVKEVFAELHINMLSTEPDAFEEKARALLTSGGAREPDASTDAQDAMPGELVRWVCSEEPSDGAVVERVSRSCGDSAVGAYPSRWD